MKKLARAAAVLLCSLSVQGLGLPEAAIATPEDPKPIHLAQAQTNRLTLLNSGVGPQQMFRFSPVVGSHQTTVMTIQADTAVSLKQAQIPPLALPDIIMTVQTTVTAADAATNNYGGRFVYQAVEVQGGEALPPGAIASIRQQLQALVGLNGEFTMDAQGNLTDFALELPTTGDPLTSQILQQVADVFKQLSNPFPAQAIGVGAQWQVNQQVNLNGIEVAQLTTYELLSSQDNTLTLAFKTEQSGSGSLAGFPGVPEGFDPKIESLTSAGEGTLTLNLTQLLPTAMQVQSETEMAMTIARPDAPETLNVGVNVSSQVDLQDKN